MEHLDNSYRSRFHNDPIPQSSKLGGPNQSMFSPNPNQNMPMLNPYQKLGKRFRTFAILSVIYVLLAIVDTIIPTGISSLLSIVVFIYQILIISDAKKAAKIYNRQTLNQFGNYLILYIIISFISVGISVAPTLPAIMDNVQTGLIDTMPYSLISAILDVCSVAIQLMAWFSMVAFFRATEAIDIQARSMYWTKLVIIAMIIELGAAIAFEIPLSIIESVIDISTENPVNSSPTLEVLYTTCMIIWNILAIAGYFKIGEIFFSLGTIESTEIGPSSAGMASSGISSLSPASSKIITPGSMRDDFATCPNCGARFQADPSIQFCPSCGSRFRSVE